MKGNEPTLYPNVEVGQKVLDYSAECSTKLPQHLVEYHEQIDKNHEDSILMISNFQSQLSVFLAKLIGAKRGMCTPRLPWFPPPKPHPTPRLTNPCPSFQSSKLASSSASRAWCGPTPSGPTAP